MARKGNDRFIRLLERRIEGATVKDVSFEETGRTEGYLWANYGTNIVSEVVVRFKLSSELK